MNQSVDYSTVRGLKRRLLHFKFPYLQVNLSAGDDDNVFHILTKASREKKKRPQALGMPCSCLIYYHPQLGRSAMNTQGRTTIAFFLSLSLYFLLLPRMA